MFRSVFNFFFCIFVLLLAGQHFFTSFSIERENTWAVFALSMASSNATTFNENDDWEIYAERLTQYFKANPTINAAILLTSVGVYKTIKNATFPKNKTTRHSKNCARNRFHESRQLEHETVTD